MTAMLPTGNRRCPPAPPYAAAGGRDLAGLPHRPGPARLGGSQVEDRGDHLVIRTPHNPTFWWGNFLLLARPPGREETDAWLERFAAEFPDARHVALGVDGIDGAVADLAGFTERGLRWRRRP